MTERCGKWLPRAKRFCSRPKEHTGICCDNTAATTRYLTSEKGRETRTLYRKTSERYRENHRKSSARFLESDKGRAYKRAKDARYKKQHRNTISARLRRRRASVQYPCLGDCGFVFFGGGQRYCRICKAKSLAASQRRYYHSDKGKVFRLRRILTPNGVYGGFATTPDEAQRINAHIRSRLREFKARQPRFDASAPV